MNVSYGEGRTGYGPGVRIDLTGDEVADECMSTHWGSLCMTERCFRGGEKGGEYARNPS